MATHRRLLSVRRLFTIAASALAVIALSSAAEASAQTVVTLSFDDGIATQYGTRSILASHGMHGTFFINSGLLGSNSYYMTGSQVDGLAADGNEIGGHTLTHKKLTDLTADQQRHEICDDAAALRGRGYTVTSFAYPNGAGTTNTNVRSLLQECGYDAARRVGMIRDPIDCTDCPYAETIPPRDRYAIAASPYVTGSITLDRMKGWITQAEDNGGGWVVLMFHDICNGCYDSSVSQADFTALLDWLQPRAANGTTVKTMHEVMDGPTPPPPPPVDTTAPTTTISCNGFACTTGWYKQSVTIGLNASDTGGSGLAATRYTTDGSVPSTTSASYVAPFTLTQTGTVNYRSWDVAGNVEVTRSTLVRVDGTGPAVAITSPLNGATVSSKQVTITASSSDSQSGVAKVEFFINGSRQATDTSSPYSFTWRPGKATGQRTLTAVATDKVGNVTTSAPVTITVR